jgi:preprotein translocase subunit SecF
MFLLSFILIAAGITGYFLKDGLNLGIDFTGGLNKQIQIAPRAFTITYVGEGQADADIKGGVLILNMTGMEKSMVFELAGYETLAGLVTALNDTPGIETELLADPQISSLRILSLTFPWVFSDGELVVNMQLESEDEIFAPIDRVRESLASLDSLTIQSINKPINQEFVLKIPAPSEEDKEFLQRMEDKIVELLMLEFGEGMILLKKTEFVGAIFSVDLVRGAIWSFVVALVLILVYITVRFKFMFAVAAIFALIHDVTIMTGVIAVMGLEVTSATIAAFLTILGYSLNDTIVVFDRIRENTSLMPEADRETVINTSITQSLSRTMITSLTTLLAVVSIYIFGSGLIKIFAFNLIIGIVVGTYSSIFIASPIVLGWMNALDRRKKAREGKRSEPTLKQAKPVKAKEEKETELRAAQEAKIMDEVQAAADRASKNLQHKKKRKKKKKR